MQSGYQSLKRQIPLAKNYGWAHSPSQEWLEYISSRGRGGRLEGGCLRLAEGDGVGEVSLLLQLQLPPPVVLRPPGHLRRHLHLHLRRGEQGCSGAPEAALGSVSIVRGLDGLGGGEQSTLAMFI